MIQMLFRQRPGWRMSGVERGMPRDLQQRLSPPDAEPTADASYLAAIGQRVRLARARRGMTRRKLCAESGVSERYVAQLEAGRGNVSVLVLRDLARGLGITPLELLGDAPEASRAQSALDRVLARLSEPQLADARDMLVRNFAVANPVARQSRIALIGLRGAGKSTLGRMLAEARGLAFHELDREIERDAGMEMAEMFEIHGQAGYRRLERAALERLIAEPGGAVIAAGGGIVAERATYGLLLAHCFTVWLRASPEDHMRRVIGQGDLRPMADNRQAMRDLKAILESRGKLYEQADAILDTSYRELDSNLLELLRIVPDNRPGR